MKTFPLPLLLISLGLCGNLHADPAWVIQLASVVKFPLGLFSSASPSEAVNFIQNKCFNSVDARSPRPLIPPNSPLKHVSLVGEEPAVRITLLVKGRSLLEVLESVALDAGARLVASDDGFIIVCGNVDGSLLPGVVDVPWTSDCVRMCLERELVRKEAYSEISGLISEEEVLSPKHRALATAEAECQARIDKLRARLGEIESGSTNH